MNSKRVKDLAAAGFVGFEAFMHVYLLIYLTFHWTNILIWGFTAFELSMFLFLLWNGKENHSVRACNTCSRMLHGVHGPPSRGDNG